MLACLLLWCGAATAQATALTAIKFAQVPAISAGDVAIFTILVVNSGPNHALNVALMDPLPGGLAWTEANSACSIDGTTKLLSCSFGVLPPNAAGSVTVSAPTVRSDCGTLSSAATATASNAPPDVASAQIVVLCPQLSVTLFPAAPVQRPSEPGAVVVILNDGPGVATAVELRAEHTEYPWTLDGDHPFPCVSQPTGIVCQLGDIPAGGGRSVHLEVQANDCVPSGRASVTVLASNDDAHSDTRNLPIREAGDTQDDCALGVGDVFSLISFLFAGGAPPL